MNICSIFIEYLFPIFITISNTPKISSCIDDFYCSLNYWFMVDCYRWNDCTNTLELFIYFLRRKYCQGLHRMIWWLLAFASPDWPRIPGSGWLPQTEQSRSGHLLCTLPCSLLPFNSLGCKLPQTNYRDRPRFGNINATQPLVILLELSKFINLSQIYSKTSPKNGIPKSAHSLMWCSL